MLRKHSARCPSRRARISSVCRGLARGRTIAAASLVALVITSAVDAQDRRGGRESMTLIKGGTVHTGTGEILEDATVIVRGSRIAGVRQGDVPSMPGVTVIDATGKHVYPGLVDSDSRLLVDPQMFSRGAAKASNDIRDAVDLFDAHARDDALSQGVTTIYVGPRGRGALDGRGGVFKLAPAGDVAEVELEGSAAMTARLGAPGASASVRLRELKGLRTALDAAKKYAESWDDYAEALAEYEEKLAERRKEAGIDDPADEKKGDEKKKGDGEEEKQEGSGGEDGKGEEGEPEKKDGESPERRRPDRGPRRDGAVPDTALYRLIQELIDQGYQDADPQPRFQRRRPPQRPQGGGDGAKPDDKKKDEKKDELEKPKKPAFDPDQEALRSLLNGEFPLRVRAERAADILNLLAIQREYHFDLIVVGGDAAAEVAEAIEDAGVPVILTQGVDLAADDLDDASRLEEAGIPFAISTTRSSAGESRFLALGAAAAASGGLDPDDALAAVTSRAAKVLGVDDRVGSVAAGKDADLVIASGPPLSSLSRVEQVLIDGKVVFSR